jgi:DNA replication initiation complex subunit (GINS family)
MPPGDEINFESIRQIQIKESRSSTLTKIPGDFYEELHRHLEGLHAIAREEVARDPLSARATLAQNELRSTMQLGRDIAMLRLRKIANRTVDALEGGHVELHNLIPVEREIYERLAPIMANARDAMLPAERGPGGGAVPAPAEEVAAPRPRTEPEMPAPEAFPASALEAVPSAPGFAPSALAPAAQTQSTLDPRPAQKGRAPATVLAPAPTPAPTSMPATGEDIVVHVLKDTPPFAGEGGVSYALKTGDIVNLPRRLAEVLLQRGMAEAIEVAPPGMATTGR